MGTTHTLLKYGPEPDSEQELYLEHAGDNTMHVVLADIAENYEIQNVPVGLLVQAAKEILKAVTFAYPTVEERYRLVDEIHEALDLWPGLDLGAVIAAAAASGDIDEEGYIAGIVCRHCGLFPVPEADPLNPPEACPRCGGAFKFSDEEEDDEPESDAA